MCFLLLLIDEVLTCFIYCCAEGQLGYPSVDTQPTPCRVSSLRSKKFSVAAANKHTAVVSETGEVFHTGMQQGGSAWLWHV